jgi:hypothetical protein
MTQQKQTVSQQERARRRAWNYLSDEVARCGGMDLQQMQNWIAHQFDLDDIALRSICRRMSVKAA